MHGHCTWQGNLISLLQHGQSLLCRLQHLLRHTGHTRHLKTEAMSHTALLELTEEDDVLADFLHRNMEVPYTAIYIFKVVKFMIMSGEQSLCTFTVFVYIFNDRTCNGHTVVGRGSATNLVKKHQRTRRKVMEDHRSLEHLHHECGFATGNIVRGTDAGEDLVAIADPCCRRRNK